MGNTKPVLNAWAGELLGLSVIVACGAALVLLRQSALYCLGSCDGCMNSEIFCGLAFAALLTLLAFIFYGVAILMGMPDFLRRIAHRHTH